MAVSRQWVMVGVVVAGLGLGAWGLTRYAPPPEGAQIGMRAPDYTVVNVMTGDSISLRSGYAGKVVLINVWATWCIPCRKEMPSMERLWSEFRHEGFAIAAVSVDDAPAEKVRAFAHELNLSFDILHDRSNNIQPAYQTLGVPQSYLLDRQGRIAHIEIGEVEWDSDANRARIAELLAQ